MQKQRLVKSVLRVSKFDVCLGISRHVVDMLNVLLCREKGYKTCGGPKLWLWIDLARRVRNGSKTCCCYGLSSGCVGSSVLSPGEQLAGRALPPRPATAQGFNQV